MSGDDPHGLGRFLDAQAGTYATALAELRAGRKRSHWMWFIFPQLSGLGRSETARFYAIAGLEEARAYLAHPVLGARLREATDAVLDLPRSSLREIFGSPDDLKFHSCMTLFDRAEGEREGSPFARALDRFRAGAPDPGTQALLDGSGH